MSAPSWLRRTWARIGGKRKAAAVEKKTEERELAPALIDERWLATNGLVDSIAGPYNAKGLHAVMAAVDKQEYGLWKVFVARLIATARRYSKDLHEQSVYLHDLHAEMEGLKRRADEAEKRERTLKETVAASMNRLTADAERQMGSLEAEKAVLAERVETLETEKSAMEDEVAEARALREKMAEFTREKTTVGA